MQGDLSTRNRTQKLKKAQPTQSISRRIEDREERAAKNKKTEKTNKSAA
jgi:ribosome biogenesis SPOUT family RNA methylase Rps3